MKLIRYQDSTGHIGHAAQQADGTSLKIAGDMFGHYTVTQAKADVHKLLAPVVPTMFLCLGLNYRRHAEETGAKLPAFPVLFMKGPNAVQNPGDPICIPTALRSDEVDYEGELAVVIGKSCKNVRKEHALEYVLGYTCANDVSARDWQKKFGGSQWCRGKSFDTFAPLGPAIVTGDEIGNPNALGISMTLNGKIVQESNTSDMIFDVPRISEFLSGS